MYYWILFFTTLAVLIVAAIGALLAWWDRKDFEKYCEKISGKQGMNTIKNNR